MSVALRAPIGADVPRMRALNEAVVPHVNSLARADFRRLLSRADYARVAATDGNVVGFLIAFLPEADYESVHFQWFQARYPSFVYIDRVAVDAAMRRRGVAWALYEDVERFARGRVQALACEVNTRPANDGSLRFHRRRGFHPVGTLDSEGGAKSVSLLLKPLGEPSSLDRPG